MGISLCLIARDEEAMLPDCLRSVGDAVDEVIVVDTGSSDRTLELARRAGAKVFEVPWTGDFSAARNAAVERASGAWVLQLDADERLAPGSGEVLRRAVETASFDGALVRLHNASRLDATASDVRSGRARLGPPTLLPRLFRRSPDLRWEGVVHESPSSWMHSRGGRLVTLDVDVIHLGYVPGLFDARDKQRRNVELLRRRCELEEDSVTPFGHLALALINEADPREALAVVERGWALVDAQPSGRSVLRLAVARALLGLRAARPERILESVERGARGEGPLADLAYLRGRAHELLALRSAGAERHQQLSLARTAYEQALASRCSGTQGEYVKGSSSHASFVGLGVVRLLAGESEAALVAFREAQQHHPGDLDARLGEAEALLDGARPDLALGLIQTVLGASPDGWVLAAAAAAALGAPRDAALFLARATERVSQGFSGFHRVERYQKLSGAVGSSAPGAAPE